ncbi:MAG: tetratricopeptide repeat protein, partial [Anaerolineae bacterium]|nr:tetratricopeptide repeat protein [Anaerolineae bacterium]
AIGDGDVKTELKVIYEQAHAALENGDTEQALGLLQQILAEDPDYADAAELRRDLVLALTPAASQSDGNPLAFLLAQSEEAVEIGQWSEAIEALTEIRSTEADFEENRVSSLFCDAYVGRGMDTLKSVGSADQPEADIVQYALADFEAGAAECPRRIDLQDQAQRATTYLELLNDPARETDAVIKALNPIVAADPEYVNGNAKQRLYEAYLNRGMARFASGETAGALGDYEAAVALGVADPGEAQIRRAELILAIQQNSQQQPVAQQGEGTPEPTPTPADPDSSTGNDPATPAPVAVTLSKPILLEPTEDTKFAGKFAEVFVEWQANQPLAGDEYFDLTVMHLFGDQPHYWGTATRETRVQLPPDIGLGRAGNDRFYWWVTIRKEDTAPSPGSLDLPRSPQSDARSFLWIP